MPEFEPLREDAQADVCIVGGGIAGIWTAYLLSKAGKSVILLEADKLGRAATLYTTAFITQVIDTDLSDLVKMFGDEKAKLSWLAGREAIDQIEAVIQEEKVDCDFMRVPIHTYAKDDKELETLRDEESEVRRLGFNAGLLESPLKGFTNAGAMKMPGQAKYHPMKFLRGLIKAAEKNGVKFHEKAEAAELTPSAGGVHILTKSGRSVEAKDVVVATYEPFNNPKPTHFKKGMYVTYVYALEIPKDSLEVGLYEDNRNPYHYFRVDDEEDKQTMIVGGEDHRAELGFEEGKSFRALKEFIDDTFTGLKYKVSHKWQGGILEPSDGLPLIGEYAEHQYVAAAFSGNGMTYSAISGKILTDLIMDRGSKYKELYDPKRSLAGKPLLYKFRDYAEEFVGGAVKNLFK
ncbi:FAD-binding oxidoreductase [Candidatus Parcubacteria bacterium]|nr:FAD-binding oxidoreductase [Candidatus Parcubacteria bacterium]